MIPSITRQAIIIKCKLKTSVMIGNYEFYYAAGLFLNLSQGAQPDSISTPSELAAWIRPILHQMTDQEGVTEDSMKYLMVLLQKYEPSKSYDDQMKELFNMGLNEERPWEVQP
ncbi:MAG: DUF3837 family protein [Lachnospiraceae bacterium]